MTETKIRPSRGKILGAVLAGGRSSRFGSDKAMAMLGGRTLLEHAIAALALHVDDVVVCGRSIPGRTGLADRPASDLGPLGGLNAALHHAAVRGFDAVLTTGCDMPVFPPALAKALIGEGAAVLEGQPLAGHWPATLAPALDRHLAGTNRRSIRGWLATIPHRMVSVSGDDLPNINTVADLEALRNSESGASARE